MNTVKLNYEIRQDLENNRVCLVLFSDEFQSDENKPTKLGCKIKFTEESIFMKEIGLLWIKKTQDALERELNKYNRITDRIDLEKSKEIYLEIKSGYEKFNKRST